ncbi:hypothetical protein NMG60_11001432 [Bertholletia excelsa]
MESEVSSWVLVFFLITFISLLITLFIFQVKQRVSLCTCRICQTYTTSAWSTQFDNLCDWYTHLLQKSPTKTIHVHVLGNIITANPCNVEHMLKTRFENYPKGKIFSSVLSDFLGQGIFNVDGETWRFQRKIACLELGRASIGSYAFQVVKYEIESSLIPLLLSFLGKQEKGFLDLQEVFKNFSFDIICKFSLGLDPDCLESSLSMSELALSLDLASKLSAERATAVSPWTWKIKRMLNLGTEKHLREAIKKVNILAQELIYLKQKLGFSKDNKDLLSKFMDNINDDEKYLRDIIISFLLAGRDTVASALTGLFRLLSGNPETVAAILDEADRVIGLTQKLTTLEQIQKLHYLQATIHESMRLYPPVQLDSKYSLEDDTLPDGTFVRKGTRVTYHPYAMGRIEEIWGLDCLEFKPERWLKDGVFLQRSPFEYPVFQAGPRVCLGKEVALVELKAVALSLLRQFHFEPMAPICTIRFTPGLTATLQGGLPVFIQKR